VERRAWNLELTAVRKRKLSTRLGHPSQAQEQITIKCLYSTHSFC